MEFYRAIAYFSFMRKQRALYYIRFISSFRIHSNNFYIPFSGCLYFAVFPFFAFFLLIQRKDVNIKALCHLDLAMKLISHSKLSELRYSVWEAECLANSIKRYQQVRAGKW